MRLILCFCVLFLLSPLSTDAQESTKPVDSSSKVKSARKISIDDFAWIAGHWQGEAMGGKFEETWNPPLGGTMMGMFKLAKDDEVSFYELLHIAKKGDDFVLRLKHFSDKLEGWEEKEKAVEFPLISITPGDAKFEGLQFKRIDKNRMNILVRVGSGDKAKTVTFKCRRAQDVPKLDKGGK